MGLQHRSSRARGGAKLAVDLVLEVKTPFTLAGPRAADRWDSYRYRPREPACLSQLTRCHRGRQHSRGLAVGQCKRRKRLVAMDVVFCMFPALIEGIVDSHTAAQGIVSFGQVQVNSQQRLLGTEECYRRVAGGLAGVFVWVWMEGKVSQLLGLSSGQCDADDEARAWESPLTPIMNVCSGRQCCMRWSMDTLDCDRYKLLLVLPRFADVSTSPVSLDHFTPACHPTTQSQQWARAPSCHVTFT